MPVHRGPLFFPKKTYINVNKTVIVNNQCNHKCAGMGMNASIFGMMPMGGMPMMGMGDPLSMGLSFGQGLKGLFDGIFDLFKKPEVKDDLGDDAKTVPERKAITTDDKKVKVADLGDKKGVTTKVTTADDPPKIEYKIEDVINNREEVATIKYGGPYHYAQYYKDANGQPIKVGSPEFIAIMNMLKDTNGVNGLGEVAGTRMKMTMPTTLTVNGKTFTLMSEPERTALGLEGSEGGADARYGVKGGTNQAELFQSQNGGTDWISISKYNSRAEAEAAKKKLEEGN